MRCWDTVNKNKKLIKKLTKKQIKLNKRERHKKTKTYVKKQLKKQNKQKMLDWSTKIKELQPTCIICGSNKYLHTHHIIPREILKTRYEILNGVTLCAKHHKFGLYSAHRNPVWFLYKLRLKQPQSYEFVFNTVPILEILDNNKIMHERAS